MYVYHFPTWKHVLNFILHFTYTRIFFYTGYDFNLYSRVRERCFFTWSSQILRSRSFASLSRLKLREKEWEWRNPEIWVAKLGCLITRIVISRCHFTVWLSGSAVRWQKTSPAILTSTCILPRRNINFLFFFLHKLLVLRQRWCLLCQDGEWF